MALPLSFVAFPYFLGGDEDKDFDIQRNVGTISIARKLNAACRSNYNLTVEVTDGHRSATTQVRKYFKNLT